MWTWNGSTFDQTSYNLNRHYEPFVGGGAAKALLSAFGGPLSAPSANRSGHVSATTAAHVAADVGVAHARVHLVHGALGPRRVRLGRANRPHLELPPDHPVVAAMLESLGEPIMSSTLQLPGDDVPLTDPFDIDHRIGHEIELIVDSGSPGIEPTSVVDLSGDGIRILRRIWTGELEAYSGSVLSHPELRTPGALDHLGVEDVYVARRISVGKFMNFSRARPLEPVDRCAPCTPAPTRR